MHSLEISELRPGMVTAEPVYTKNKQVIIKENVTLDKRLIARLEFYSISAINVISEEQTSTKAPEDTISSALSPKKDPINEAPIAKPVPENKTTETVDRSKFVNAGNASNFQKLQRSDEFHSFQVSYSQSIYTLKNYFEKLINREQVNFNEMLGSSMKILSEHKMTSIQLFDLLHNIRQIDDTIFAHCLNVAFISRVLGKWMKLDREEIDMLTLAGLLHDIGKLKIPNEILAKPDKLTDEEFAIVKKHAQFGYEILKSYNLPERVLSSILHHHERCDGSGYPDRLPSDRLDDFTMIIATADVYDAMTASRCYRSALCPFTVIENFEKEGLQKYRPHVILTFLERIANTYQNNRVLLSNGAQGIIIMLNSSHLSKPIIKLDNGDFIDLSSSSNLRITSIL